MYLCNCNHQKRIRLWLILKLLLVEDDENLAYMEKSCFEDIIGGYEVKTAVNGKEGLKVWQDFQPDVIVSDIDMPIMDGIEMVKNIREVDGETIILFTTGLTSPKDLKAGYAAGANNYVKKPFIPEELDAHIHSLIQLKAGNRSENASSQIKLGRYITGCRPRHPERYAGRQTRRCLPHGRQRSWNCWQ